MLDKYSNKPRTRQTFTLVGLEHSGARAGNERRVYHVKGDAGLLAVWGTAGEDMRHIQLMEARIARAGFPVTIECDWIPPDEYERDRFRHRYWVWQDDHLVVLQ